MSLNGQNAVPTVHPPVEDWDGPLYAQARVYPSGHRLAPHSHPTAQLLYAATGVMTVRTEAGVWVAPPQRAVWIPAGTEHETTVRGELSLHSLFIWPDCAGWMPAAPAVVGVTPLLRALILAAIELPERFAPGGREERILNLILDEMRALSTAPLHLPEPSDRRLLSIAATIRHDPADRRGLAEWARSAGASERTLARLFQSETGMTFAEWRRQARLLAALAALAEGRSVSEVAYDVGYESPSAFVAMFRRSLGQTPARYFG
jgi:AraC-like DNA-binding protein